MQPSAKQLIIPTGLRPQLQVIYHACSLGLLLGAEAPVLTPESVESSSSSFLPCVQYHAHAEAMSFTSMFVVSHTCVHVGAGHQAAALAESSMQDWRQDPIAR